MISLSKGNSRHVVELDGVINDHGNFGIIHRALFDGRPAAAKLFRGETGSSRRKLDPQGECAHELESLLCVRGRHGVVKLLCPEIMETSEHSPAIIMELLDGMEQLDVTMLRLQTTRARILLACVLGIKLGKTLAKLAEANIVHCDIKPENILMETTKRKELTRREVLMRRRVCLVDFGLAKESGTVLKVPEGSPYFMSPEHVNGSPLVGASDVFSVGTLLYEILTSYLPFSGGDAWKVMRLVGGGAFERDWTCEGENMIPSRLKELIDAMHSMYPSDRPSPKAIRCECSLVLQKDWKKIPKR